MACIQLNPLTLLVSLVVVSASNCLLGIVAVILSLLCQDFLGHLTISYNHFHAVLAGSSVLTGTSLLGLVLVLLLLCHLDNGVFPPASMTPWINRLLAVLYLTYNLLVHFAITLAGLFLLGMSLYDLYWSNNLTVYNSRTVKLPAWRVYMTPVAIGIYACVLINLGVAGVIATLVLLNQLEKREQTRKVQPYVQNVQEIID